MGSITAGVVVTETHSHGPRLLELLEPVALDLARVEELLSEQVTGFDPGIQEYVRYVLGGNGKRLRPSLALLAGGATGRIASEHITLGVIVELIHIATLVHDDVLDEAEMRHGLPTANSRWTNEISVLLGDCLFAHALKLAAGYPSTAVCRRVSDATNVVCAGEIVQTQRRFDLTLALDEYLDIIQMKTGALFAVSCELGSLLNGAAPSAVKSMAQFGGQLGIAYQIFDDCVDILGQEGKAGKSLGTDVKKGKLTLPYLLLLEQAGAERRAEWATMIFRDGPDDRQQLRALILGNGVVSKSLLTIEHYIARAKESLDCLPSNTYVTTLGELLTYLSRQSRQLMGKA